MSIEVLLGHAGLCAMVYLLGHALIRLYFAERLKYERQAMREMHDLLPPVGE